VQNAYCNIIYRGYAFFDSRAFFYYCTKRALKFEAFWATLTTTSTTSTTVIYRDFVQNAYCNLKYLCYAFFDSRAFFYYSGSDHGPHFSSRANPKGSRRCVECRCVECVGAVSSFGSYHHFDRCDFVGVSAKPNQRRLVGQRAQREISFGAYRDIPRLVGSDDSDDSDDLYRDIPQLVSSSSDEDAYASDDEDAADS
jgi:hypothetical protein